MSPAPSPAKPPPPPSLADLRSLRCFLDEHFASRGDLSEAPPLEARLRGECAELEESLRDIEEQLAASASAWIRGSSDARIALRSLRSAARNTRGGDVELERLMEERVVKSELPLFARETGRIETIRLYAEATLQLEALVGNLEDAAFAVVRQASKQKVSLGLQRALNPNDMEWKQEKLLHAVNALKDIEQELVRIRTCRPQWTNLVMAVDSRVENILAILRPQALTDHRALLAALRWPPSLLTPDKDKYSEIPNPLVLMNGKKKEIYSQSFLALCALQHVQTKHEARQCPTSGEAPALADSEHLDRKTCFDTGLWAVDELVRPIASRMEYHFSKWSDQPEFIFALVYKITKDFMDGVDNVLQPLIDKARLAGLSAKESWVTAMVKMLLGYLERQVFPVLDSSYHASDEKLEILSSWLHLVDQMNTFDKRMQLLAAPGIQHVSSFSEGFSRSLSIFSLFSEHSDWLQTWAEVELTFARHKLESEMEDETSWLYSIGQHDKLGHQEEANKFLLSTREDYKAPPIADFVVKTALSMVERGRALPNKGTKIQYARSSAALFLNQFFIVLSQRCEELQLLTSTLEQESLLKIAYLINTARYCEFVLREWDEDITFLDMTANDDDGKFQKENHRHSNQHQRSFFADEVMYLVKLETDYLEQIMSSLLLEFEDLSWDYTQNIGYTHELTESNDQVIDEESLGVSPGFVAALDMLTDQITKLKLYLNSKDFLDLWRSIAEGLDYFIYSSIHWGDIRFSNSGVSQLKVDMKALFYVFSSLCSRPEAFFPFTGDCLKLLTMAHKDADYLLEVLKKNDRKNNQCLEVQGLFNVSASQAETILRNRTFRRQS